MEITWTDEKKQELTRLFGEGKSDNELVDALNVSKGAIQQMRSKLKLLRGVAPSWLTRKKNKVGRPKGIKTHIESVLHAFPCVMVTKGEESVVIPVEETNMVSIIASMQKSGYSVSLTR